MDLVDIGGGFTYIFPGTGRNFDEVGPSIGKLIDQLFPDPSIRIIGEPGRFISESSVYVASQVIGKKNLPDGKSKEYFINNGIYQSYSVRVWGEDYLLDPIDKEILKRKQFKTTWWGQSNDEKDWVRKDVMEPEFNVGDWVVTKDHGPYCSDIQFGEVGFKLP